MFARIHFINLLVMGEVLLGEHLYARFLTHRDDYRLRLPGSCLVCLLGAFLFPVPQAVSAAGTASGTMIPFGILMYLTILVLSAAGLCFCYQEDLCSILFCVLTGYTVHQLASGLNDLAGLSYRLVFRMPETPFPLRVLFYLLTLAAVMAGCYALLSGRIRQFGQIRIDNKKMLGLSGLVLIVDVVLGLVNMHLSADGSRLDYQALVCFYNATSCVFILWLLFGLLANRRLELELSFLEQMLAEEKKQYQMSRETIDIINVKCHDLKHQIRRLRKGNESVDRQALKEIENAVGIYDSAVRTGNDALDVILTEKSLLCEKENILLSCIAEGDKIRFISPGDIYALFGNALDNAMEAVRKVPDKDRRSISVHVRSVGHLLSIHVENCFTGSLTFVNELPRTNKADTDYHGFGMRSMQMIAEKYGGHLTADAEDGIFRLDILIPIP